MNQLQGSSVALLDEEARAWLDAALREAADAARSRASATPAAGAPGAEGWELRFASAGRFCGSAVAAEAARVLLLRTASPAAADIARLYSQGTAAERCAVLLALPFLGLLADEARPLVEDALRTNDTRLVTAAVGPWAGEHLDAHGWRHAVLKCLFTGVSLEAVTGWEKRARGDAELARMLEDYAREREAAGREVPADLHRLLVCTAEKMEA